jgi:hypothetical protein
MAINNKITILRVILITIIAGILLFWKSIGQAPTNILPAQSENNWQLIRVWDMENGKVPNVPENGQNCNNEIKAVTAPTRSGSYSLKTRAWGGPCNPNGPRAALSLEGDEKILLNNLTRERRYMFSMLITTSSQNVGVPDGSLTSMITQWYGWTGNSMDWQVGIPPTLTLWQRHWNGQDAYDFGHTSELSTHPFKVDWSEKPPFRVGQWEDWDIRVRWSRGSDGYVEAWKNGNMLFRRNGPTLYNPSIPESYVPRWDIGTYSGNWEGRRTNSSKSFTTYFDDIKIYVASSAPTTPTPTPTTKPSPAPTTKPSPTTKPTSSPTLKPSPASSPVPTNTSSPVACHLLDSDKPLYDGFAASYDVHSPTRNLILTALCNPTQTTVTIGNNDPTVFVYSQGYSTTGGNWNPVNFTCAGESFPAGQGASWCRGNATGTIPSSDIWYISYTCKQVAGLWKCGCRDSACANSFWQIQGIKK